MIIIVEGIDRVGKTTLCEKLNNELSIPIYKNKGIIKYSKMNNIEETDKMFKLLDMYELTKDFDVIFDRFNISDYVYGSIERRYDRSIARTNMEMINERLANFDDALLILVTPTDIERSSKEHGKDLKEYNDMFKDAFDGVYFRKIECNYNEIDDVVKIVKEMRKNV